MDEGKEDEAELESEVEPPKLKVGAVDEVEEGVEVAALPKVKVTPEVLVRSSDDKGFCSVSMLLLPKVKDADGAAVEGRGVEELPNVNVWAVPFDAAASVL